MRTSKNQTLRRATRKIPFFLQMRKTAWPAAIVFVSCFITQSVGVIDYNRHLTRKPPTSTISPSTQTPDHNQSQINRFHVRHHGRPDVQFRWNWGQLPRNERWWQGPNVCSSTSESHEVDSEPMAENSRNGRIHHQLMMTSYCDDTENAFKCVVFRSYNGNKTRLVTVYECCHGYYREPGTHSCSKTHQLQSTINTLENVGGSSMVRAINSTDLISEFSVPNLTIFAPIDAAFEKLQQESDNNNIVVIRPALRDIADNMEKVLRGHLVDKYIRSSHFTDDLLLPTANSRSKIRINVYSTPKKLITANCVPVVSLDNMAEKSIVHTVEHLLMPVEASIINIIAQSEELSSFYGYIGLAELTERLQNAGHLTVFAPTNIAVSKLSKSVRDQVFSNRECVAKLILHHVVEHTICSAGVVDTVWTQNILGNRLNLSRQIEISSDILRVNSVEMTTTDVMTTNGVVHFIDEVLIPDGAMNVLHVAKKLNATNFVNLIDQAGLQKTFSSLTDFTLFLPVNSAFGTVIQDQQQLTNLVLYHVVGQEVTSHQLNSNHQLKSLNAAAAKPLQLYTKRQFSFTRRTRKFVQCSNIISSKIDVCGGTIYLIDKVLSVPDGDLLDLIYQRNDLSQLVTLLKDNNLAEQVQTFERVTFFAPTNRAFESLPKEVLNEIRTNPTAARRLILRHIVNDFRCCSSSESNRWWMTSDYLPTADGRHLVTMTARYNSTFIDGVSIQSCDIPATNGILHIVDQFLPSAIRDMLLMPRRHDGSRYNMNSMLSSMLERMNTRHDALFTDDDDDLFWD